MFKYLREPVYFSTKQDVISFSKNTRKVQSEQTNKTKPRVIPFSYTDFHCNQQRNNSSY